MSAGHISAEIRFLFGISHPNAGYICRRVTDKPYVRVIIDRAGFARQRMSGGICARSSSARFCYALHHINHCSGDIFTGYFWSRIVGFFQKASVTAIDFPDQMRRNAHTFIRESRISGNHFNQRNFACAECGRQTRSHRIRDAETPDHLCARLNADLFEQMNSLNIHRFCQRGFHRHISAAERTVIIVRHPTAAPDRCAADHRFGCHSPFNRRRVDKRFVSRAGLTQTLCRVVKFAGMKIISADHRNNLARVRVERNHRGLHFRHLGKRNLQSLLVFVDFFYFKLRQITDLQFACRFFAAFAHIFGGYDGFISAETH